MGEWRVAGRLRSRERFSFQKFLPQSSTFSTAWPPVQHFNRQQAACSTQFESIENLHHPCPSDVRLLGIKFWESYDLWIGERVERESVDDPLDEFRRLHPAAVVCLGVEFGFLLLGA